MEGHWACDTCGARYSTKTNLQRHMEKHSTVSQKCHCGAVFTYKECLQRHMQAVHMGGFKCNYCPAVFQSQSARSNHGRRHGHQAIRNQPLKCQICDKEFGSTSHLKDHLTVHVDHKPYKCDRCTKTFKHKRAKKLHSLRFCKAVAVNNARVAQKCSVCDKTFSKAANLKQHMQKHQENRRPCPKCGRVLKYKSSLSRHITTCFRK